MIRPILAYGNPLLKQKSFKVDINNEDVSDLIFDMWETMYNACLLYTSGAADEGLGVDLGGRRIIKKN